MSKPHISWLSEYIQFDTTANAGNEERALLFMKELAERNHLYSLYLPTAEDKGNLVIAVREEDLHPLLPSTAAISETWSEPPVVLLSHVDVVGANPDDWEHPPFSGVVVDDEIWGRGAIDAKQIGMTHLMAMIELQAQLVKRPILQVITCEEETGSGNGLKTFLELYPSLWQDALIFNEGGGFPIDLEGHYFYLMETGQKGNTSFTITTSASQITNPYMPSNDAALKAFEIGEAIAGFRMVNEQLPSSVEGMFSKIAESLDIQELEQDWQKIITKFPKKYQRFFSALTKSTMTVTSLEGGKARRGINGRYRLTIDSRPLPDIDHVAFKEAVEGVVKQIDAAAEIDWHQSFLGYDQSVDTSLIHLIEAHLTKVFPAVKAVPFMTIGSNDGRYFQQAGAKVIGYCPMLPDMTFDKVLTLVHGINERISIKDYEFGIAQLTGILKDINETRYLGGEL